jgi:hypothetical protein
MSNAPERARASPDIGHISADASDHRLVSGLRPDACGAPEPLYAAIEGNRVRQVAAINDQIEARQQAGKPILAELPGGDVCGSGLPRTRHRLGR